MAPKYLKKKQPPQPRRFGLFDLTMVLFLALLLVAGGMLLKNALESKSDQDAFRELAALVDSQTQPSRPPKPAPSGGTPGASPEDPTGEGESEATEPWVSPYQVLYERNQDFVAWLTVPGTRIDYPVVHTPEDTDYYIYRAFDGSDSPGGTPFVGDHGSLNDQKCIIYGHNMGNGTMFHDLLEFIDKDFWKENPTFTISTLTETREYEIFAVVQTRLLYPQETGLRFYRLEDGLEEWLRKRSLYDTGVVPEEGDSIVLLTTCSYHTDDGRFLVAGRWVK